MLDRLNSERDKVEASETENRDLRKKFYVMKEEFEEMQRKMSIFDANSPVDAAEIEEALVLIRQRNGEVVGGGTSTTTLDFLQKVDDDKNEALEQRLVRSEAELADAVNELEKTRNLLIIQHKINKDYQKELEVTQGRLESSNVDFQMRAVEYARLLDLRATKIKKLETQLKDIAYGTQRHSIVSSSGGEGDGSAAVAAADDYASVDLRRGQNVFEIRLFKVTLNEIATSQLGDPRPSVFCTWEFFEHPIQTTPVLKGPEAMFDSASRYVVTVDDFFLQFLQRETTLFELHQVWWSQS